MIRYFEKFKLTNTEEIPAAQLADYAKQFNEFTIRFKTALQWEHEINQFCEDVRIFLKTIANDCRAIWAQFDANLITQGLLFTAITTVFIFLLTANLKFSQFHLIFTARNVCIIYMSNIALAAITPIWYFLFGWEWSIIDILRYTSYYGIALLSILLMQNWDFIAANWSTQQHFTNLFTRSIFLVAISTFFSNSFVIYEQTILAFLLSGALIVFLYKVRKEYTWLARLHKLRPEFIFQSSFLKLATFTIVTVALLRLSYNLHRCREEHGNCNDFQINGDGGGGTKLQNLRPNNTNKLKSSRTANWIDLLPILILAVYTGLSRIFLRKCGNLSGSSPHVLLMQNTPIISAIACLLHFLMNSESAHPLRATHQIYIDAFAWTVYIMFALQVLVVLWRPLMLLILQKQKSLHPLNPFGRFAPHLVMKMKEFMYDNCGSGGGYANDDNVNDIPIVYGLATVYSSVICSICIGFTYVLALLLGSRAAIGIFIVLIAAALILVLNAILRYQRSTRLGKIQIDHIETLNNFLNGI